jgi:hypothetical protein
VCSEDVKEVSHYRSPKRRERLTANGYDLVFVLGAIIKNKP